MNTHYRPECVFMNSKLPNNNSLKIIEENMHEDLTRRNQINSKIEKIVVSNSIPLIFRKDIFYDVYQKKMPIFNFK